MRLEAVEESQDIEAIKAVARKNLKNLIKEYKSLSEG
jgi:hypothetical protein